MATVLGVRSFGRELHRISAHTHTTQAQPKGLGQPCRASQASEANGQLHPHRQLELSLQTVGRPCALMMMQIPVVLLQGKGVGLAPSLGILRPNSRQRNCLPISVFCFRGSRQRNRRPSSPHHMRLALFHPASFSARPSPFHLGALGPRRTRKTRFCRRGDRRTHCTYMPACGEQPSSAAHAYAMLANLPWRRLPSDDPHQIAALDCYHEALPSFLA